MIEAEHETTSDYFDDRSSAKASCASKSGGRRIKVDRVDSISMQSSNHNWCNSNYGMSICSDQK